MRLTELIDLEVLRRLTDANYEANGMPIGVVDAVDGSILVGVGWQDICVRYHRAHAITAARCRESDDHIKRHLSQDVPCEYRCRNGLRDIGIPILVGGAHLATLFMGQFLYEDEVPERGFFVDQARSFGFDERAYLAALDRVPVFERRTIQNILVYNTALARFVSEMAEAALRQREANAASRAQTAELQAILNCIADGVIVCDREGRTIRSTPSADRILRVSLDDRRAPVHERVHRQYEVLSEDGRPLGPDEMAAVRAAVHGETIDAQVVGLRRPGESTQWIRINARPLEVDGQHSGAVLSMTDITDRKRAAESLRESAERYERQVRLFEGVASTTPDFVYLFDREGRFLYANQRLLDVWGMKLPDVVGKTCLELGYERWHHDMHMREIAQVIETKRPIKGEVPFKAPLTGLFGVYEYIFTPVVGPDGEVEIVAGTTRDVTERKGAENALREANERLREADRRKDEFLGMLSHELRNPLAPIRTSVYLLDRVDPAGEQARRARSIIERQAEHLTRLVDDLLDVTRIARGKIHLRRGRVDLRDVVSRAADDFRFTLEDRGVSFRTELPAEPVWADADSTRVTQIVGNLIHNAAKFTKRGDAVAVTLLASDRDAEIRVADSGCGIDPGLLPHVFEPFIQGERTLARTEGGLGLGLSLVRGIAELHGGSVAAESAGKGKGAAFVVRLPKAVGAAAGVACQSSS